MNQANKTRAVHLCLLMITNKVLIHTGELQIAEKNYLILLTDLILWIGHCKNIIKDDVLRDRPWSVWKSIFSNEGLTINFSALEFPYNIKPTNIVNSVDQTKFLVILTTNLAPQFL